MGNRQCAGVSAEGIVVWLRFSRRNLHDDGYVLLPSRAGWWSAFCVCHGFAVCLRLARFFCIAVWITFWISVWFTLRIANWNADWITIRITVWFGLRLAIFNTVIPCHLDVFAVANEIGISLIILQCTPFIHLQLFVVVYSNVNGERECFTACGSDYVDTGREDGDWIWYCRRSCATVLLRSIPGG
jgi:hypothetical protein